MPYTFWHAGVLIGETDFEGDRRDPPQRGGRRHLVGVFRPTGYGRRLLPRLCGILTAMSDLKDEVDRRGLDADDLPADTLEELFVSTSAGAHVIDIGRVLSEVELRSPIGSSLEVASMGFMDLAELKSLSRKLALEDGIEPGIVESDIVEPDASCPKIPEFLVSVTLSDRARAKRLGRRSPLSPWVN